MPQPHGPTPSLRRLTIDDFASCQDLWRRCSGVVIREWESPQSLAALVTRNPGGCWVIEQGQQLLGTILAGHDGWRGYIYHAAVDPQWQRAGLGTTLVHQALAYFSSQGIERIHLLVSTENQKGRAFWRAVGAMPREDVDLLTLRLTTLTASPVQ